MAFASLPLVPFKACTLAGTIRMCVAVSTRDQAVAAAACHALRSMGLAISPTSNYEVWCRDLCTMGLANEGSCVFVHECASTSDTSDRKGKGKTDLACTYG